MDDGGGADSGEGLERFFRPRDPLPEEPDEPELPAFRPDRYPTPSAPPRLTASPPRLTPPGGTPTLPPMRPPPRPRSARRRAIPSPAQQRLMARIAASRKARQQRALLMASGLLSALVLLVAGGAWALTGYVNGNIGRVDAGTLGAPPGGPLNILVVGVDIRAGLSHHQQVELHTGDDAGANTDTMMVVHLSADRHRVTVVSLPRDSWLDIPGHGMNKINAAYGLGGPKLAVQTVEQATGLMINDYVGVNFLAVVKVVDALGGVDVCLPQAVDDPYSGLDLPAGRRHVNGITALEYVRDRHSFGTGDLTRIQDQQKLLASLLREASSGGTLGNPARFARFLNATLAALQVDRGLNAPALANQMRGISASDVAFATVPLSNADYQAPDGQSAVLWDTQAADLLFTDLAEDKPLVKPAPAAPAGEPRTPRPQQVTVDVYNGTLIGGLSASTGARLSQRGFHAVAGLTWYRHDVTQTEIEYPPGQQAAARLLHASMPGATLLQQPGLHQPRILLGSGGYQLTAAGRPGAASPRSAGSTGPRTAGAAITGHGSVKAKTAAQAACG